MIKTRTDLEGKPLSGIDSWRSPNLEGWFNAEPAFEKLADYLQPGDTHVEIGMYKGKSMACLLEKLDERGKIHCENPVKLIGIDIFNWQGKDTFQTNMHFINILRLPDYATILRGDSQNLHHHFADESLASVYVDGAHDYYDCLMDMINFWRKLKEGGLMLIHDYAHPGLPTVKYAVDQWVIDEKAKGTKFTSWLHEDHKAFGHACHTFCLRKGETTVKEKVKK